MRKLISLRDQHGVAVLVVHHTKKGTRYEPMHNDNMRGSMVFGASSDSVLMVRRSAKDESIRVWKPTKLRNGDDEMRKARLLSLDQDLLWFLDIGEANEAEHIAVQGEVRKSSADDKIDFVTLFGTDTELSRKQIVGRAQTYGFSNRTIDRCLKEESRSNGILSQPRFGQYSIKPKDDEKTSSVKKAA